MYKISLLQMPNGTGKTTTLRLLRAALTGPEIWDGNFEKVKQFRKNVHSTNGNFILKLLHNGRRLTIEMQFDFQNEEIKYSTTNIGGKESGFRPPAELRPFLSLEFVKLLVFDGELAAQLLDSNHTNAQKAIEEMYQLSYFSKMKERIDEYWNEMASSLGSKGGTKELSRRRGRVESLQERYNTVKTSQIADNKKLDTLRSTLKQLNEEFRQQIAKSKQDSLDLAKAQAALSEIRQNLATKVKDMAVLIKNPIEFSQAIAESVFSLKESLDKAKLPGVAAREFFDEIAEEPVCICGREIDEAIKIAIKTGAKKYLGSEEMNVLNAMKTDIRNRFPNGEINSGIAYAELLKMVEELQEKESLAQQNLDIVKIKAGDNNPEIGKIQDKINSLNKSLGELVNEMRKYEAYDDSDESWNLDLLAKRKAKAEEDLADATGTMELKKKKDILNSVLDKAFNKSLRLLSEHICDEANRKIKKIMPYNNISIDTIDRSLRLVGKDGGSVGETLSVGYAFLSSLLSTYWLQSS